MNQAEYEWRRAEIARQTNNHMQQINACNGMIGSLSNEMSALEGEAQALAQKVVSATEQLRKTERDKEKHQATLHVLKQRSAAFGDAVQLRKARAASVQAHAQTVAFAKVHTVNMSALFSGVRYSKAAQGVDFSLRGFSKKTNALQVACDDLRSQIHSFEAKAADIQGHRALLNNRIAEQARLRDQHQGSVNQLNYQLRQLEYLRTLG
jgi:chromosome segregation ATPase